MYSADWPERVFFFLVFEESESLFRWFFLVGCGSLWVFSSLLTRLMS